MVTGGTGEPGAAPPAEANRGRRRGWRGPALFASLVLNLFLIGLIAGGWAHHRHGLGWIVGMPGERGAPRFAGGPPIRQAVQSLPEADQRVFKETMGALRPEIGREQQAIRRLRERATEAVRAEPFDRAGFLAAMAELRQKQLGIQTRVHAGTADALSKLSAESRGQFADQFKPRPRP
ncbi:MAG: periplasmic heavy metal sensor [Alphaproteobacteria bacterium]|nr:periplasmic heavy metal sensor [Alphaproteobacteria bacterium]